MPEPGKIDVSLREVFVVFINREGAETGRAFKRDEKVDYIDERGVPAHGTILSIDASGHNQYQAMMWNPVANRIDFVPLDNLTRLL